MISAKAEILSFIAKQQGKPFKAIHVEQDTMLVRQVVHYHLKKLVADGVLEKDRFHYTAVSNDLIIDLMLRSSDNKVTGLLAGKLELLKDPTLVNATVERIVVLRNAKSPASKELTTMYVIEVEKTIEALKGLKRYLTTKTIKDTKAHTIVRKDKEVYWEKLGPLLMNNGVSRVMFEDFFKETNED